MSDQIEFQCPQCKRRTVVPADQNDEDTIYCPKCEVAMARKAKVSQVAEASANAPTESSNQAPTLKKSSKAAAKSSASKATKSTKSSSSRSRSSAVEVAAVAVVTPEFGEFRCPCCGQAKTIAPGDNKPGVPARCQACFVKLEFVR